MRFRLSLMMALVYSVQGAFWPLLAVHLKDLGIDGWARGWIFATCAMGSMAMPLGAGHLVDRFFSSQKVLSVMFLGALGFLVAMAMRIASGPLALFLLFQVYWLITAPAYALSNTIAMRHLPRPMEQFSGVRLWGTAGWMLVGWTVSLVMAATGSAHSQHGAFEAFWVGAALSVVLAVYSLTLPETPPLARVAPTGPGLLRDAFDQIRRPGMTPFLVTALGVHMTAPFVFQVIPTYLESEGLPRAWISSVLTLGQILEIGMLAALPWLLRRLGPKPTLVLGISAWAIRYGILASHPPLPVAVASMLLHGIGIACFSVAGQVYMDSQAPADRRASAQGLYLVITSGLGSLLGSLLAGDVLSRFAGNYSLVFLVPCVIDSTLIVYFCAGFQPNAATEGCAGASNVTRPFRNDAVRGTIARVGTLVTESADG